MSIGTYIKITLSALKPQKDCTVESYYYRIVFPGGDQTKITVAQVYDYEEDEYLYASKSEFTDKEDAVEYAKTLARKHSIKYEGDRDDAYRACLD